MKNTILITAFVLSLMICPVRICAQNEISITTDTIAGKNPYNYEFSNENLLKWSVWRTDFYICTAIAFAKENGLSVEDFAEFGAKTHLFTWNSIKGKGIDPIVQALIWFWKSYQSSNPEILDRTASSVTVRFNKPYKAFFPDGKMLDVTISEFEAYLFGHIRLMMSYLDMKCNYTIEDEHIDMYVSMNN
jgi:hypothetical protein